MTIKLSSPEFQTKSGVGHHVEESNSHDSPQILMVEEPYHELSPNQLIESMQQMINTMKQQTNQLTADLALSQNCI